MMLLRSLVAVFFLCLGASAQLNRGTITGTVQDPSGAAIPGVKVTIESAATGALTETTTNDYGQYTAPYLPVGAYQLTFEAPAFKRLVRQGVNLGVTEVLRVNVTLEVGATAESVTVSAEVPRLATDSPEVGTSLGNKQLIDLPLSFSGARLAENFAYKVTPGVSGSSWQSNINGSTAFSKETLLDGATVTTYLSGHFGESSVSVEALQEFKIQTSGMSAEFGRAQGGVFNFVMKSGSNDIHGSAYLGLRNEALNANTFVNNFRGVERPPDRQQNYAFSFGGPVYLPKVYNGRNKTFFYTTYERFKRRIEGFGPPSTTAPQPEWLDGDLSRLLQTVIPNTTDALGRQVVRGAIYDPATFRQLDNGRWVGDMFPGNRIPVARFSDVSRRVNDMVRNGYLPTVRNPDGTIPLVNNAVRPVNNTPRFDQYQFSTKVDQMLPYNQRISGSYSYTARPRLLLDQTRLWNPDDPMGGPLTSAREQRIKSQLTRLAHDWNVSPAILNNFTVYYNRMANPNVGAYRNIDGAKELGIANLSTYGYPNINWGGGPFVGLTNIGDPQNDFQVYMGFGLLNTVSWSKGRHFVKMGIDHRRNHLNTRPTQGGSFNFNARATAIPNEVFSGNQTGYAFASYLLGIVDSAGLSDPVGLGGRRSYTGLFIQDDFKVSSNLTLNIGLRWEFQHPFTEVADRLSSWSPRVIDPESGLPGAYEFAGKCDVCTGRNYFGVRSFRDFGPRIGFAWRPLDKWTVRGAYGIMYEGDLFNGFSGTPLGKATSVQVGGTYVLAADPVNPWAGIFNWDRGFPTDRFVPAFYDRSWGNLNRPGMVDENYGRTPYTQMWNFNIQRELARNTVLDIGYVANKMTGLRSGEMRRINQIRPEWLSQYGARLNNAVRNPQEAAANGIAYPYDGFRGTVASALRDFPQVQGNQTINVYGTPIGFSTYHSLQVVLNKEFSRGLTTYFNYVWSKNLTNVESSMVASDPAPLDYYNLRLEKALANDDQPHMFKGFVNWELPIGRGKALLGGAGRVANALLSGWSVSAILNYFSGEPLAFSASSPLSGAWNGGTNRPNVAPGQLKNSAFDGRKFEFSTQASPNNTYLNKELFSDVAPLTLGTGARRYNVRRTAVLNEDFGLQKNTRIGEKYRLQFRAEFLNGMNRNRLGAPNTNVTSPIFGQITSLSGNREVQLGLRLDF